MVFFWFLGSWVLGFWCCNTTRQKLTTKHQPFFKHKLEEIARRAMSHVTSQSSKCQAKQHFVLPLPAETYFKHGIQAVEEELLLSCLRSPAPAAAEHLQTTCLKLLELLQDKEDVDVLTVVRALVSSMHLWSARIDAGLDSSNNDVSFTLVHLFVELTKLFPDFLSAFIDENGCFPLFFHVETSSDALQHVALHVLLSQTPFVEPMHSESYEPCLLLQRFVEQRSFAEVLLSEMLDEEYHSATMFKVIRSALFCSNNQAFMEALTTPDAAAIMVQQIRRSFFNIDNLIDMLDCLAEMTYRWEPSVLAFVDSNCVSELLCILKHMTTLESDEQTQLAIQGACCVLRNLLVAPRGVERLKACSQQDATPAHLVACASPQILHASKLEAPWSALWNYFYFSNSSSNTNIMPTTTHEDQLVRSTVAAAAQVLQVTATSADTIDMHRNVVRAVVHVLRIIADQTPGCFDCLVCYKYLLDICQAAPVLLQDTSTNDSVGIFNMLMAVGCTIKTFRKTTLCVEQFSSLHDKTQLVLQTLDSLEVKVPTTRYFTPKEDTDAINAYKQALEECRCEFLTIATQQAPANQEHQAKAQDTQLGHISEWMYQRIAKLESQLSKVVHHIGRLCSEQAIYTES